MLILSFWLVGGVGDLVHWDSCDAPFRDSFLAHSKYENLLLLGLHRRLGTAPVKGPVAVATWSGWGGRGVEGRMLVCELR